MTNNEMLKKKIIYRSSHRGSKEMDLLLGGFVKSYINKFNSNELLELEKLLLLEDEIIYNWYFKKILDNKILDTKVSTMLKNYKL
jgi:antitoxin CptB